MSDLWIQGRTGRSIDLLEPSVAQVDFDEIAEALARLNRYGGHAETPCSVGQHTLIACEAAPKELKPFVLLHDAHETRLGDILGPAKRTLALLAGELFGDQGRYTFVRTLDEFEHRHDAVIHAAAGLPLPTDDQRAGIKRADLIALVTERRDFMAPSFRLWDRTLGIQPLARVQRFRSAPDIADALRVAFHVWLPALRARAQAA